MFVSLLSALTSDPQHDHSHQQTGRHIHRHSHHHNHKHNHGEALRDVILLSFQESQALLLWTYMTKQVLIQSVQESPLLT